jgi:hypothetical protein
MWTHWFPCCILHYHYVQCFAICITFVKYCSYFASFVSSTSQFILRFDIENVCKTIICFLNIPVHLAFWHWGCMQNLSDIECCSSGELSIVVKDLWWTQFKFSLISESFSNLADHVISFWVKKVLSKHSSHYDPYPSYKEVFRFEGPYFGTFKYCKVQFTVKFCTHRVLSKTNTIYEKFFMDSILHSIGTQYVYCILMSYMQYECPTHFSQATDSPFSLGWSSLLATFFATVKALAIASFTQTLGCLLLHAGHYLGNVLTKRICVHTRLDIALHRPLIW